MIINGEGRFILLDKPASHPYSDIVTATPEGPVFDLSVDLEYYSGVVYLKAEHVEEMAHTLGMVTKVEADEMRATIIQLEAEKNALPAHVESLLNGINSSITGYFANTSGPSISIPVYLSDPDPGAEKPDSADSGKSAGSGQSSPAGNDKPAGKGSNTVIGKGPDKLPAGTNDGFLGF